MQKFVLWFWAELLIVNACLQLCWQPLEKLIYVAREVLAQGARLEMRLAKVVADGREWLRYLATSP